MARKLRERLKELSAFLEHHHDVEDIDETVEHLQLAAANCMARSRAQAQQCTILLFQSHDPPSLLEFLDASILLQDDVRKRKIAQARDRVLKVLAEFLETYGANKAVTKQHIHSIFKRCQEIARGDESNRVKVEALTVIIKVLDIGKNKVTKEDIQPAMYLSKLFYDLKFGKATQTAKGQMLEVVGHLVSIFPSEVEPSTEDIIAWVEGAIEKQLASNAPELALLNGLFRALTHLLVLDNDRYRHNANTRRKIYSYLNAVLATTIEGNLARYQVTSACILFLSYHADIFSEEIGVNGVTMFSYMKFCCTSESKTIKEHAFTCNSTVLKVLCKYLVEEKDDSRKKTLNRILQSVIPILIDRTVDNNALGFVMSSLGQLTHAIYVYLGESGFTKIEARLKKQGEELLGLNDKATSMRWSLFSQFVHCIGQFVEEKSSDPLDYDYVTFLGDVVCHIMTAYAQCMWKSKVVVYKSILLIFMAVSKRAPVELLIDRCVRHCLLLTVSNLTNTDVVLYHPETGNVETKLLYEYENFWTTLLRHSKKYTPSKSKGNSDKDEFLKDVPAERSLHALLVDSLMKNIIRVVDQLDLSYKFDLEAINISRNSNGYYPNVARDHTIMINMAEFVGRVLPKVPKGRLVPWIPILMRKIFIYTGKMPLVSSFYHLGKVLAGIIDEVNYFSSSSKCNHDGTNGDVAELQAEYGSFVSRVSSQLRFYQDELLIACAEFVLSTPVTLVPVDALIPALRVSLAIGRSYLPAAEYAVNALKKWQEQAPYQLEHLLDDIIPMLAPYLDEVDVSVSESLSIKSAKIGSFDIEGSDHASDLAVLQRHVLVFLGNAGGKASWLMSKLPSGTGTNKGVRGLYGELIQVSLDLGDTSIALPVSSIMQHVGRLAIESTNRRIKSAASEIFHALVCYLCGQTATHPHASGTKSTYYMTWKSVFSDTLCLATDAEKICRGLFEPLVFQLGRWFCSNNDVYPFEFAAILEELMIGLSHPSNSATRALAGKCIAEILRLAIEKQARSSGHNTNVEEIFERLFSLCRHPGSAQRIGAAIAISYFLRSVSEENAASISIFALSCLRNFLYSLRLSDRDGLDCVSGINASRDMISKAVLKLQRGILRFPDLFLNKNKKSRQTTANQDINLEQITEWLFQQIAARERSFCEMCRKIFFSFASVVSGSSTKEWIVNYAARAAQQQCHPVCNILAPMNALASTLHSPNNDDYCLLEVVDWTEQLCASLDGYIWCDKILEDNAADILIVDTLTPSKYHLKRKATSSDCDEQPEMGSQSTITFAIHTFLRYEYPQLQTLPLGVADGNQNRLLDTYLAALASLCQLIIVSLKPGKKYLSAIVNFEDFQIQELLSSKILQCLERSLSDERFSYSESVSIIKSFISEVRLHNPRFPSVLRNHAKELIDSATSCFMEIETRNTCIMNAEDIKATSGIFNELVCTGVLNASDIGDYKKAFAIASNKMIDLCAASIHYRNAAVEAIKAASACGWDITLLFENDSARRRCAPIYNEIIVIMPALEIWRNCAQPLILKSRRNTQVLRVLIDTFEHVASLRVYIPQSAEWDTFVEILLPSLKGLIQSIEQNRSESQVERMLLEAIRLFVEISKRCSTKLVNTLRIGPLPDIRDAILALLRSHGISYLVKADILRILALMGPRSAISLNMDGDATPILDALKIFVVEEFPIVSTDVKRGSKDYDSFCVLFEELLSLVEASCCIEYLRILFPSLKEGEKHLLFDEMKAFLTRFSDGIANINAGITDEQVLADLRSLTNFLLDATEDMTIRKIMLDEVFTPSIERQQMIVLNKYYLAEMESSKTVLICQLTAIISNSADSVNSGSIFSAAVAFALVEILYRLGDGEYIRTEVNTAFLGHNNGKGREFTMLICKSASKFVTKSYDYVSDVLRFACCAAYNCLLTAVSRTQKQEKFYDQILFQESLWVNIVDPAVEYEIRTETKPFPRAPLSNLSSSTLQHYQQANKSTTKANEEKSRHNTSAALQFFTGSSLSQADTLTSSSLMITQSNHFSVANPVYGTIEIELDSINEHPCMVPLLRVLVQMKSDFGANWNDKVLPDWMKKLYNVVESSSTELNTRLFLVKTILNIPHVFELYAAMWLEKILDTIMEVTVSYSEKSTEFNYLLRDTCHLVIDTWKDVHVGKLKGTSSRFVNTAMKLCPYSNYLIMEDNIMLTNQLIALWKDNISIDVELIRNFLCDQSECPNTEAAKRYTGLQLVSAMIASNLVGKLQIESYSADDSTIEDGILEALQHKSVRIYTIAAEVGGLYLQSLQNSLNGFRTKFIDQICRAFSEEDYGRFLALLRNASLHQPDVIDGMMLHRLSFVLPKVIGIDKWSMIAMESLNNATKNTPVIKDIFPHVHTVLDRYIAHRHPAVQYTTLQVISHLIEHLNQSELERLSKPVSNGGLGLLEHYESHEEVGCRRLFYQITIKLYQSNIHASLVDAMRCTLLRGFSDEDASLRKELHEFWNASKQLPLTCCDRLVEIFRSLFSPEVADKWVLYATNLLIGLAKDSQRYNAPLFQTALSESEYHDTNIDATWETKSQSMTPIFSVESDTFNATAIATMQENGSLNNQDVLWGVSSQFGCSSSSLFQSQLVSSALSSQTISTQTPRNSQRIDSKGTPQNRRRFVKRLASNNSNNRSDSFRIHGKADSKFFQEYYAILRRKEEATLNRQRKARREQVSMMRKYRVGKFPDIQIELRDIIDPIMLLCGMHAPTSSIVFAELFASLLDSTTYQDKNNVGQLCEQISKSLSLAKSSPMYVGCIHMAFFASMSRVPKLFEKFDLPPTTIGESSLASKNYHSGEMILEEALIFNLHLPSDSRTMKTSNVTTKYWDQLYKILATIQKSNYLIALSSSCCTIDESKVALQARLAGDLPVAIASYKKAESILAANMEVLDDDELSVAHFEARRCYWERLDCLERLNNWEKLQREFLKNNQNDTDFIWNQESPYLEQGIGHLLRLYLGLGDEKHVSTNEQSVALVKLKTFLDDSMQNRSKWELIRSRFDVELSLARLKLGEVNYVRVLVESFYFDFLKRWRNTSPIATLTRLELLQALSSNVELDSMLALIENSNKNVAESQIEKQYLTFINKWTHATPSKGEGAMVIWSQFFMVQQIVGTFLLNHGRNEGFLSDSAKSAFLKSQSQAMLEYAKAAVSNDILALASKYLKDFRELCNEEHLPKVSVLMADVFVSHVLKLADRQVQKSQASGVSDDYVNLITKYYQTSTKMFDNPDILEMMEMAPIEERVAMGSMEAKTFAKAAQFYMKAHLDKTLMGEYFTRALDVFQRTNQCINSFCDQDKKASAFVNCRLMFTEFLTDLLFKEDQQVWERFVDRQTLIERLVENVLGGMEFGDRESANYFPQLCEIIAPYPTIVGIFKNRVLNRVPVWTCLPWTAQLMALVNGPIGETIGTILEKMASQYPVALFYDFKVTFGDLSKAQNTNVNRLAARITNPAMETFVDALRLVHHPELRLKEGLRDIAKLVEEGRLEEARAKMDHVWFDCFSLERPLIGGSIGRYNRDWARRTKKDIEKIMGKNGSNLTLKTVGAAREWIMNHFSVTPGRYGITKDMKVRLGDFTEWLEEFDHTKHRLELPGQYGAYWRKPDPSTHIYVLSFDSMLDVLASKQLPKRLSLHCSDEKDYTFLVKGGEDLRLDQRIEQLFDVMNQILHADPRCRDRLLSIRTYKVIPMTQEIGIIEWIDGTSTLKGIIEKQLQRDDRCVALQSSKQGKPQLFNTAAAKKYESFLLKQRGVSFSAKVIAPSRIDVTSNFETVKTLIPGDLLRRQLLNLGANFESFLSIRDEFGKSLAVFNACSYILGIGDRHLDNFLLDQSMGTVIGIDFGISFGAGASLLPVPELIPFRYTRQMDFVFQPYDGASLLVQDMQTVFEALREKRQVVESVMNVFLHEPLLDWQQSTTTHQKEIFTGPGSDQRPTLDESDVDMNRLDSATDDEENHHCRSQTSLHKTSRTNTLCPSTIETTGTAWLPDVKIAIARRKLNGFAPKMLLKEELAQNPHIKSQLPKFQALVDSACAQDPSHVVSNQQTVMSSLAQAQELFSIAKCPNLLGRTYHGWMPWL